MNIMDTQPEHYARAVFYPVRDWSLTGFILITQTKTKGANKKGANNKR